MDRITDPVILVQRFNAFAYSPTAPEELKNKLQTIPGSQADIVTQGLEILYAHFDLLDADGKAVLGVLSDYGVYAGWAAMNVDGRLEKIRDRVRADLGEDVEPLADENMPEPEARLRGGGVDWRFPPEAE